MSNMSDILNVGMIGCGEIAVQHAKALDAAKNVKIGMVMDVNQGVAKDLAERYKVPYTTIVDELLANHEIQAVYIAVPHYLHAPLSIKAAEAQKHIMVEKPIAVSLTQADDMIAAAKASKVLLSVCFVSRYDSRTLKAKELVEAGVIGEVFALKMSAIADKPETYWHGGYTQRVKTDWRTIKAQAGGGILIMNIVHDFDQMRYITGLEAVRLYAEYDTFTTPVEVEDMISVVIRYNNGAIGSIEAASCAPGRGGMSNRIYGKEGQIALESPLRLYTTKEGGIYNLEPNKWHEIPLESKNSRQLYIEDFAQSVLSGASAAPVSGEDGRATLAALLAAYESGEKKMPVWIET